MYDAAFRCMKDSFACGYMGLYMGLQWGLVGASGNVSCAVRSRIVDANMIVWMQILPKSCCSTMFEGDSQVSTSLPFKEVKVAPGKAWAS